MTFKLHPFQFYLKILIYLNVFGGVPEKKEIENNIMMYKKKFTYYQNFLRANRIIYCETRVKNF